MRTDVPIVIALLFALPATAQEKTISFSSAVEFETGDTWTDKGRKYRLYGVQACLRGTMFRSADGAQSDCGMRSVASLAALFSTGTVVCQSVGIARDHATFVICAVDIADATLDVGAALVSAGVSFAAAFPSGVRVSSAYAMAELTAKENRNGLWSGAFVHPVTRLLNGR
jgi:endonuclease YncB( thermonuclease family)